MSGQALPDILERIVAQRRARVAAAPASASPAGRDTPLTAAENDFLAALACGRGRSVIAEVKLGSPRLGDLRDRVDPLTQARAYAQAGAAALSVVVEPDFFHGSYDLLRRCREASGLPALAKDFVIDPRQLEWARAVGADAVLLIAALQSREALHRLAASARALGLAPLVEIHTPADADKLSGAEWELIGINHRDLRTFEVDLELSRPLLPHLPPGAIKVAESGIRSPSDVERLAVLGFDAFLIGETLLTAEDPATSLAELLTPTDHVLIKVCGVTRLEDAVHAADLGVDCLGLNFYPRSPRHVTVEQASEIADAVRGRVTLFGVFVNAPPADIERTVEAIGLDRVQFHGDETPADLAPWGERAVKVVRVEGRPPRDVWDSYPHAWGFLVEARHETSFGGTGRDWNYAALRDLDVARPWLLAGGLRPDNARQALDDTDAAGIDVCSGVELRPGIKDPEKMGRLVRAVRQR